MKAALLVFLLCGSALADFAAGVQAIKNGDHVAALKEFLPLAKEGDAGAQVYVGFLYGHGQGIPHDYNEAALWFRLAAEQGRTDAQLRLGTIYEKGSDGFAQDYKEAAKWYRMAAEQGNAMARFLRQTVKSQKPLNGELTHGIVSTEVHEGSKSYCHSAVGCWGIGRRGGSRV